VKLGWFSLGLSALSVIAIGVLTLQHGPDAVVRAFTDARYAQEAWLLPLNVAALATAGTYLVRRGEVGLPVYVGFGAIAVYLAWLNLPFGAIVGIVVAFGLAKVGKHDA